MDVSVAKRGEEGYALAAVLLIVTLLSIIGLSVGAQFREEQSIVLTRQAALERKALSEWVIAKSVVHLTDRSPSAHWELNGSPHKILVGDASFEVRVSDEVGKIDLNSGQEEILSKAFEALDVEFEAEEGGNNIYERVSEMGRMRGLSQAQMRCAADLFTVHSHRRSVDTAAAETSVLDVLEFERAQSHSQAVSAIRGGMGGRAFEVKVILLDENIQNYGVSAQVRLTEDTGMPIWVLGQRRGEVALSVRSSDCES